MHASSIDFSDFKMRPKIFSEGQSTQKIKLCRNPDFDCVKAFDIYRFTWSAKIDWNEEILYWIGLRVNILPGGGVKKKNI